MNPVPLETHRPVGVLVGREVRTRLRDRTFLLSTAFSLLLVVALAVLPAFFGGGDPSPWRIGAVGDTAVAVADTVGDSVDREVTTVPMTDDDVEAAVRDGDVTVAIRADGTLVGDREVSDDLGALVPAAWREVTLVDALVDVGVDQTEARLLATASPSGVELLDPPDEERDRRVGFLIVGVILLYGQLIGYGYAVSSGIVEEKSSRVVELLLAKVRTRQLLTAKIVGIGGIGLIQLLLFVVVGLAAFRATGRFEIPPGIWPSAASLVAWYVAGFLLYSAMFAVVGALAARAEDLQSSSGPVTFVLVGSFIGAVFAATDPDGTMATALSFVPFTAPMIMPLRSAADAAPWWQVGAAATSVLLGAMMLLRLADLVYRRAALSTSSRRRLLGLLRST